MLELYNKTNCTKRIPRYKYNGTYTFKPGEAIDIPNDQAYFFKPYARIGIVVQVKRKPVEEVKAKVETEKVEQPKVVTETEKPVETKPIKPTEIVDTVKKVEVEKPVEEVETETTEPLETKTDNIESTKSTETKADTVVTDNKEKDESVKINRSYLSKASLATLKEIAEAHKVKTDKLSTRADYKEAIIKKLKL